MAAPSTRRSAASSTPASARAYRRSDSSPSRRRAAAADEPGKSRGANMAMNVGTSGGQGGDGDVMLDINTTPLIDVMLVLLVMLIITIPIQLHSVNLNMPVGTPPQNDIKPEKIQIDIDEKSTVYWQGLPVTAAELDQKMTELSNQGLQPEI